MSDAVISIDDAASRFPELVARTQTARTSFIITENGRAVARLSPAGEPALTCAELAARIATQPRLSPEDADTFHRELLAARKRISAPHSKWD